MARRLLFLGLLTMPWLSVRVLDKFALSDGLFVASAGALACSLNRRQLGSDGVWWLATWLVMLGGIASSFQADSMPGSLAVLGRVVFLFTIWRSSLRHLLDTDERLVSGLLAVAIGCAVSAGVAVGQARLGLFIPAEGLVQGRALGLTEQPNDAGGSLVLGFVLALGGPSTRHTRFPLLLSLLIAVGLVLSGSVTGMAAAMVGALSLFLIRGVRKRTIVLSAVALIAVYPLVAALQEEALSPLARIQQSTGGGTEYQDTFASRVETYRIALTGIRSAPLVGVGLDEASGMVLFQVTGQGKIHPVGTHNMPLLAWYQGGVLVVVGFAIVIGASLKRCRRLTGTSDIRRIVLCASVAELSFAMTAPVLFQRYFWFSVIAAANMGQWQSALRDYHDNVSVPCVARTQPV